MLTGTGSGFRGEELAGDMLRKPVTPADSYSLPGAPAEPSPGRARKPPPSPVYDAAALHMPSAPLDIPIMLGKVCREVNEEAHMPSTPTRDLPEEFLAATRKSQEAMIRAIRTWVETVRTVTPKLPSAYAPLADRLPKLPSVTVPFADRLPKPEDVVASGYDFAEHLLANQRKFAEDLLAVTEPLIPANGKRAWNDATRKDAAAAAEKTVTAAKTAVTETAQAAQKVVTQPAAPKPAAQAAPKPAHPAAPEPAQQAAPKPAAQAAPKPAAQAAPKPAAQAAP